MDSSGKGTRGRSDTARQGAQSSVRVTNQGAGRWVTVPGDANARVGRQPSSVVSSVANLTGDRPVNLGCLHGSAPISVVDLDAVPQRGNSITARARTGNTNPSLSIANPTRGGGISAQRSSVEWIFHFLGIMV